MVLDIYIGDVSELLNDEKVYESYLSELSEERKNKLKKIKSLRFLHLFNCMESQSSH